MEQPRTLPYIRRFAFIFFEECYRTWRSELLASVCVAGVSYVFSHQNDLSAGQNLKVAIASTTVVLGGFAAWHLIRTPFLLHKETVKHMQADHAQAIEAERLRLRNELSETCVTAKDWRDLAEKFENACRFLRADFQLGTRIHYDDYWRIAGGHGSSTCEAWLKQAGAMLMKSPVVRA